MDYWQDLDWEAVDSLEHLWQRLEPQRVWLLTKFGTQNYCDANFAFGDTLFFGSESNGLPQSLHERFEENRLIIPMPGPVRCLNLATSAGIVMYEAARQMQLFQGN